MLYFFGFILPHNSKYVSDPISNTPIQQNLKKVLVKEGFILTQLFLKNKKLLF
jgi:hypothetical protein